MIDDVLSREIAHIKNLIPHRDQILTREETAKRLNVDYSTLWLWTKKGKIKAHGLGNRVYYYLSDIEAALKPLNHK